MWRYRKKYINNVIFVLRVIDTLLINFKGNYDHIDGNYYQKNLTGY